MERIALVDLDGTLADYDAAMKRDMELIRSPHELTGFIPHGSREPYIKERERMIRSMPGWWLNLEPLKSGFEIVELLRNHKYDLHVLTKAPHSVSSAWTEKVEWCKKYLPEVDITISQDKSLVYGKILVDDWPPYVTAWLEHRPRGLVILPDQRWNVGVTHPNLVRYDGTNIAEVSERIAKLG